MNTDTHDLFIRRIDERWHIVASARDDKTEQIHFKAFADKHEAYGLRDKIERALASGRGLNLAHWSSQTVTLTGYLGQDREVRHTRTTVEEIPGRHVSDDEYEYTTEPYQIERGGREFIVLSLATNQRTRTGWRPTWHRLVLWNSDRGAMNPARLCGKGFKVQVRGRREEFVTADGCQIPQVVVDDLRILKWKAPEYP